MPNVLDYHRQKILDEIGNLPEDKIIEVVDFIEFLKKRYINELKEKHKDFELEEKKIITSPQEERRELEKTGKYSKDFLDQFEKNIAKSSIYSK